jgi:hypothetical protein
VLIGEATQTNLKILGLTPPEREPTIYRTSQQPGVYLLAGIDKIKLKSSWRVPLMEQELSTLPEHMRSCSRFLVWFLLLDLWLYVYVLYIIVFPFVLFSVGHCVVCTSSIYGFWLPLWYLQALPHSAMYIIYLIGWWSTKETGSAIRCISRTNPIWRSTYRKLLPRSTTTIPDR